MSKLRRGGQRHSRGASPLRIALLLLSLSLFGGCSSGAPQASPPRERNQTVPAPGSSGPAERGITDPPGVIVVNGALGADRHLVSRAVADVRETGFWKELTGHLYSVRIGVRPGEERIPEDGHLADALRTLKLDGDLGGIYCQITFYSAAMSEDLLRVADYHRDGLISTPPPSERQFYAAILGHELAHCLGEGKGEPVAQAWEAKVLEAVQAAGIP